MAVVPKIVAVSYLNTIPFVYGIEHEGSLRADLTLAPPAECARLYMEGEADIALLPAAVVPQLKSTEIITDYCIGAVHSVRTVELMSNSEIKNIRRIFLDAHSRTSVQLLGYLAKSVWRIDPEWCPLDSYENLAAEAAEGDAFLLIGDKVFDNEGTFRYSYDLAEAWQGATKLPFCFAVWVARKGTPYSVIDSLQRALTFGIEHTYEAILEYGYGDREYAYEYLTHNIDFLFDEQKHKALQKFWNSGIKVEPRANPG